MTDIFRDDIPDLPRARTFGRDWHIEYERPTTSAANQSGFHTAKALDIHSKTVDPSLFGYVANGATVQVDGVTSTAIRVPSLSFPATSSIESFAIASIRYPAGWPRNEQVGFDIYYFTTAASSTLSARFTFQADLRAAGADLSSSSANAMFMQALGLPGSTAVDSLQVHTTNGFSRTAMRTMQDAGTPYSFTIKLLRQSSTAADTLTVPLHIMAFKINLESTF